MRLPKIKEISNILNFAKKCFTKGSFRLVDKYISGLIAVGKKTINKISKFSGINQQTLNYTLNEAKFKIEELEKRYFQKIKYLFKDAGIFLIIDDTLVERDGKNIELTQKHFDHNSNDYVNGHQFFTAILCTSFLQLPIFPNLYHKETDSKIGMAQTLVDKIEESKIKIDTVLFDSWYSDKNLINKCRSKKWKVICSVKSNRNIFLGKSNIPMKISFINQRLFFQEKKKYFVGDKTYYVFEKRARLNKIPSVKFIISQEINDGKIKSQQQIISTNENDSPEKIISTYKLRWRIETFHRDIKQNLGFADAFLRRGNGIVSHAIFVAIAYAVLSLFMFRKGIQMSIGECCEYLRNKSTAEVIHEIVIIDDKRKRLSEFEEVFIN